jgi:hypothetical protein
LNLEEDGRATTGSSSACQQGQLDPPDSWQSSCVSQQGGNSEAAGGRQQANSSAGAALQQPIRQAERHPQSKSALAMPDDWRIIVRQQISAVFIGIAVRMVEASIRQAERLNQRLPKLLAVAGRSFPSIRLKYLHCKVNVKIAHSRNQGDRPRSLDIPSGQNSRNA